MKGWDARSKMQKVDLEELRASGLSLYVKREDELHSYISGNKFQQCV